MSRYVLGIVGLVLVAGPLALAAVALRRRFWPRLNGASARLAEAVAGLTLLTWTLEAVGLFGGFRFVPIVAACVVVGVGLSGARVRDTRTRRVRTALPAQRPLPLVLMVLAAIAVVADWAEPTVQSYRVGILGFDSLWYHLPWAASFAQTGHVASLHFTDVEYLTAFYPATAELFHSLGIVLFGRDTLSPGLDLVWLALVVLAGYCVGRPRGLGPATATGAVLAMALPMLSGSQGGSAANDAVGVFFLLAAAALLDEPVLAGAAAGLAVSVKLTLLAPVAALLVFRGRRPMVLPLVLTGGFWYARNLIAVGNPLPWFGPLPRPVPPLQQHTGFTVWHYLFDTHAWSHFIEPALRAGLGPWWPAILVAALLGPIACLLPPAERHVRLLGLVALASLFAYLVTPESAAGPRGDPVGLAFNLRYAAPAIALSLTVLPLAPAFAHKPELTLAGLLALITATLAQARLWPGHDLLGALLIGAAFGAALLVSFRGRIALASVWLLLAIGGYPLQRSYLAGRYVFHPGVSSLAHVWALFRGIHHARVAVVGTFGGFFSYPLYGVDGSNMVQYVAHRGPHGSFTPITSCSGWRTELNAGHFRYVVTTPSRDPWHPRQLGPSPEGDWTSSSAASHVIYRDLAGGQPITVFKLDGRLNPASCR